MRPWFGKRTGNMQHDPKGRISLQKNPDRVRILAGDSVIADSRAAIELRETGYPARQYLPRGDVDMGRLRQSPTTTHCPFKGDATYYSVTLPDATIEDAAWSYEDPFAAMDAIRGHVAFDSPRLTEVIGDRETDPD
jgi:uncharacterized protein (DUF427 family)